jgi:protein TonB
MARPAKDIVLSATRKRVLVATEDPWLRFRLASEFELAGCEVIALARLLPGDLAGLVAHDVVLTDAALLPEGSRLEALRALRARSPRAKFVLLVGSGEDDVAEQARRSGFDLVLERPTRTEALPELVRKVLSEFRPVLETVPIPIDFQVLLEGPADIGKRHAGTAVTSLFIHGVIFTIALLVPLVYTETLDVRQLANTWLAAPPPPPPPPPPAPAARIMRPPRRPLLQTLEGKLIAPTVIPKEIAQIIDAPETELDIGGVLGGVPGGVPGGRLGGVLGGVLGGIPLLKAKPPAPPKPVRVGGRIRPPRLIRRVAPVYPAIAQQARIQGSVRIDAIIDTSGRVVEVKILSGHPLLVRPALDAVQRWVYEPTYLNEQPVAVLLEVTVNFSLR